MTLNYSSALEFKNSHIPTTTTINYFIQLIYLLLRSICGWQNTAIFFFGYLTKHRRTAYYIQTFERTISSHFRNICARLLKRTQNCIEYLCCDSLKRGIGLNTNRLACSG
jgi:hypothetical protein